MHAGVQVLAEKKVELLLVFWTGEFIFSVKVSAVVANRTSVTDAGS